MKFQIYLDTQKQFRWRLKSANNEPLASGEGYTTKENCMKAISLVQSSSKAAIEDQTAKANPFSPNPIGLGLIPPYNPFKK